MKNIAIIGAGPSGIAAIKNISEKGFSVTCFERCAGVGGNWRFNDPSGHSSVFETTHIISSKFTSHYEDFPFPSGTPDYPSHQQLLKYFNDYADNFDIKKYINFGTEVTKCSYCEDGSWEIEWRSINSNETRKTKFDHNPGFQMSQGRLASIWLAQCWLSSARLQLVPPYSGGSTSTPSSACSWL